MEADFSGWVTKAGLKCSDGRTIMPDAFKHQDTLQVPLVWQHGHTDPENVLGHVILENREEGVYGYGFFNKSNKAAHARELLEHKDIDSMSIWANQLIEKSKRVFHGVIREVSLVLAGANPGAKIENVQLRHGDGDTETLEDEAIITTGLELDGFEHADAGSGSSDKTVQDVVDSMTEEQKQVLYFMVGEALASAGNSAAQSGLDMDDQTTIATIVESMTEEQQAVLYHMVGTALEEAEAEAETGDETKTETTTDEETETDDGSGNDNGNGDENNDQKGNDQMKHNVFEKADGTKKDDEAAHVLSHDAVQAIVADAKQSGSLKAAVTDYALAHGIEDIDILFPDAKAITNTPELFGRRVEWVNQLLTAVKKTPFSRIKTLQADITTAEARAKGYIKGNLKKEEFFKVARRVTVPTTIYKKQKLDRDDILDITDFDIVAWLKGEMRLMLDEELARAILVGDGRAADDEDKIDEEKIRPIASDHELYTTVLTVNIGDAGSDMSEVSDAIILNRSEIRGSGMPTMYTTERYLGRYLTLRDTLGRRIYKTVDEVATELRVKEIVTVEVLEEYPDIVAIIVNPVDYTVGATAGGQVSMFDDFDIDYNQQKYLIETRCCGALTKLKAAMVVRRSGDTDTVVVPAVPTFDGTAVTIVDTANVVYRNAATDAVMNAAGSPYAVAEGETLTVTAEAAAGHYVASSADDGPWSFTNEPA